MKEGSRANALLVELLLVIFFFMIAAAILVQVFADAKLKSRTAGYSLKVTLKEEETDAGLLRTYDVSGIEKSHDSSGAEKETVLLTLPSTRYIPKEVSP